MPRRRYHRDSVKLCCSDRDVRVVGHVTPIFGVTLVAELTLGQDDTAPAGEFREIRRLRRPRRLPGFTDWG